MFRPFLCLAAGVLVAAPAVRGQTARDLAERHPAAQTVVQYLRLLLLRDYGKAGALVHPGSLQGMKEDYLRRVKQPNLPLDEVLAMCRALGVEDESAIQTMTPSEFFIAYNKGMQKRYNVTDEVNQRISDTLELNLLAAADERPTLVHFLVRTKHETMRNLVENLEIVSLLKERDKWLVGMGEQKTKVTPIEGRSTGKDQRPAPGTPGKAAPEVTPNQLPTSPRPEAPPSDKNARKPQPPGSRSTTPQ
ncbi:MAG: hypothetical protein ACR2OZ_00585 [Verrucomicrobiales bacterium]